MGVYPIQISRLDNLTDLLDDSITRLVKEKLMKHGDRIVIVCDNVELSKQIGQLVFVVET